MSKPNDQNNKQRQSVPNYMKYSGMAIQMGVIILLGVYVGKWLDEYFQTAPYLTVALALFSIFAALYTSLKDLL
ncbi:MAG: AtpZ/AtpI family protein [Bacteroidota bacterium]